MRKTVFGDAPPRQNDWIICYNGQSVGRIMLELHTFNDFPPWTWATWCYPAVHGRVSTMEAARDKVRDEVLKVMQKEKG